MKHIYLLFFLCLLCSCKESEKRENCSFGEGMGWERDFLPPHSVFTIQGKDTIDFFFRRCRI